MNELEIIKISIIIPVYNGAKYLEQCIKSALGQTLKELEIICVDDGSTDDSMRILRQMQKIDTRITIYHQNNLGAGAARNLALTKARGKYVAFLGHLSMIFDAKWQNFCVRKIPMPMLV